MRCASLWTYTGLLPLLPSSFSHTVSFIDFALRLYPSYLSFCFQQTVAGINLKVILFSLGIIFFSNSINIYWFPTIWQIIWKKRNIKLKKFQKGQSFYQITYILFGEWKINNSSNCMRWNTTVECDWCHQTLKNLIWKGEKNHSLFEGFAKDLKMAKLWPKEMRGRECMS